MKASYAFLGLGLILIIGAAWYFISHRSSPQEQTQIATIASMELTSSAFANNGTIPKEYTCDNTDPKNPPLSIAGAPAAVVSFALVVDDPDVPKALKPDGVFDHWVVFNIPATTTQINSGDMPGVPGANGAGKNGYAGPCPPPQYEPSTHRYFFRVYALDTTLDLPAGASKAQVLSAIEGHVLEEAELVGTYSRK